MIEPETKAFCVLCFASQDDGSWGGQALPIGHCMNCSAGGSVVAIPGWAIESIRKNASWVGRRYYPGDEDHAITRELTALRESIGRWPGRTLELVTREDEPNRWRIRQLLRDGRWTETSAAALPGETMEQAMQRTAAMLPWVPEETANADR